jgi:hypothetical protein
MEKTLAIYGYGGLGKEVFHISNGLGKLGNIFLIDDSFKKSQAKIVFSFSSFIKNYYPIVLDLIILVGDTNIRKNLLNIKKNIHSISLISFNIILFIKMILLMLTCIFFNRVS